MIFQKLINYIIEEILKIGLNYRKIENYRICGSPEILFTLVTIRIPVTIFHYTIKDYHFAFPSRSVTPK